MCTSSWHKAKLFLPDVGHITQSSFYYSFPNFYCVEHKLYASGASTVLNISFIFVDWDQHTISPDVQYFPPAIVTLNQFLRSFTPNFPKHFHTSAGMLSGPIALPGHIFLNAFTTSSSVTCHISTISPVGTCHDFCVFVIHKLFKVCLQLLEDIHTFRQNLAIRIFDALNLAVIRAVLVPLSYHSDSFDSPILFLQIFV